ncbi:MAG: TonB-dependent receptor [Verrucomicrobia bacterium]|nr:TonB-dependent receptor [Verrucomicrobiota bacterium]
MPFPISSSITGDFFGNPVTTHEAYDASEDVYAAYVMGTFSWGRWSAISGVRVEHTRVGFNVTSQQIQRPPEAGPFDPNGSYTNVLPSVHLRYEIREPMIMRLAWSHSVARPEFNRLAPFETINVDNLTGDINIDRGNPDLKAVESSNLDLMFEYYLDHGGILSVGLFYKRLDGPIYRSIMTNEADGVLVTVDSFFNAGKADLMGVELNYQTQFRFLPGVLSGLGMMFNATITRSDVDVPQRPGEKFSLFRQSDHIGNIALTYDRKKFDARLAFNWRSDYLLLLGTNPLNDSYEASFRKLDFQAGYRIRRGWKIMFDVTNITNEPQYQITGGVRGPTFYGLTGRTYALGVQATFLISDHLFNHELQAKPVSAIGSLCSDYLACICDTSPEYSGGVC